MEIGPQRIRHQERRIGGIAFASYRIDVRRRLWSL